VLRWQIQLDDKFHSFLKRPNAKLDAEVLIALRLGAFQLLHLDRIPARAAIDESVELAKQSGHRFASGMVNAVLRKLAASKGTGSSACMADMSPRDMAVAEGHPAWMVERWADFFGLEAACAICRHDQAQPALTIRIEEPAVESELAAAGIVLEPGKLLTSARYVTAGDLTVTAAIREGRARIQDEGSQLVAEIAGVLAKQAGETTGRILDCCAAPGGKTLILAERNPEARIVACEASAPRLEQLRKRLADFGDRIELRHTDATVLTDDSVFDVALADVPCSGTGTLARNPEIRHRLHLEDLPRQAERQGAILTSALRAVRPGGRVVYSTCSLEPEENEQVVDGVIGSVANVRTVPLAARVDEMLADKILTPIGAERLRECLTPSGYLRLFSGSCGTDGFFMAVLQRSG
jgi:16S rRNA (cytosine967-C5)-methyltransferase